MKKSFLPAMLLMTFGSLTVHANKTDIYIDAVRAEGALAPKAVELDKLFCVAGTKLGEEKKKTTLCAHEVKAMMQHFAMTQNLGLASNASIQGPEHHFQNTSIIFRANLEIQKKKDGTPQTVLRLQRLKGAIRQSGQGAGQPISSLPKKLRNRIYRRRFVGFAAAQKGQVVHPLSVR